MPLLVAETETPRVQELYEDDPAVLVWWGSEVECMSAVARLERDGAMTAASVGRALDRLSALARSWHEIQPAEQVRALARRLLRVHPLRTADSLQLAAALVAAEGHPASLELISFDDRLVDAARREGLQVIGRPGVDAGSAFADVPFAVENGAVAEPPRLRDALVHAQKTM